MYPRIVRQIEFIGSVGALGTAGVAFALSKSIDCSCSWQRQGYHELPLKLLTHDALRADVGTQCFRNQNAAIRLLVILDNRHPRAANRQSAAI